jgi:uncharacterized protein YbjT (DUF2867 family)
MILVLGAAGTVGTWVVRELSDQNTAVRAGVHTRAFDIENVETCHVDFNQPETLPAALEDVHTVFFVLPISFNGQAMLAATRNLIDTARSEGVEYIVKLSTYGAAEEGYVHARWHRRVEREIEQSGIAWTFLRPNTFMQSMLEDWEESIRKENAFYDSVVGPGYAPIDARDIARVAACALTEPGHEGKAYELTGPEALSWDEAAETLSRVLGRSVRYVCISDKELRQSLLEIGLSEEMAEAYVDVNRYVRRNPSTVTSSVQDVTDREPISFEEFCREHAATLAANP